MAKRLTTPPRPPPPAPKKQLTVEEMKRGIGRLQERLQKLESFDPSAMKVEQPPELSAMQVDLRGTLEKIFGEDTASYRRFASASDLLWSATMMFGDYPALRDYQDGVREKISHALAILGEAIRFLNEEIADASDGSLLSTAKAVATHDISKVFVVHGHDGEAKHSVARFIEKLGFEAVILHERANKGRTIITKFREESADVGFAVVLMTADDVGGVASASADKLNSRARQNVVFELGFFIGALGAERVAAMVKGNIEKPSDFDGVVYISLDGAGWQMELGKELQAAGYPIDWNRVMS